MIVSIVISIVIQMSGHQRSWIRRSVGIPKGFLSYIVLRILDRKPMSGSEIMEEVEEQTGWRPSPGSIYPLLARFRYRGIIEEVESEEAGLRRFILTEKGRELLGEYERRREIFRRKFHSIRRMWLKIYREMDENLYQAHLRLFEALEKIAPLLKKEGVENEAVEVQSILLKAAEEVEKLRSRLEEKEG